MSSSASADRSSGRFALDTSPRILIAGYGRMGAALGKRLASEGCRVWGLRRSPPERFSLIRYIQADLLNVASLNSLPAPLDYVFYLASSDSSELAAYRRAYVEGLQNLLDALERVRANALRLFFSSSTGVYGQTGGEWVDESSVTAPGYPEGEILLEGERRVISGSLPGTVVRFGGIYGPGRNRLLGQIIAGEAVCSHEPRFTNHIHIDDCAGILHHLMTMENPESVYLAVDREPVERCEFLRWLAQQMDAPPPRQVPFEELGKRARRSNKRCSSQRIVDAGYSFRYPGYRDGYSDLIRRFLAQAAKEQPGIAGPGYPRY